MEKQRLLNVYVNNLTMMESVNRIHDMIREKQTSYVYVDKIIDKTG